MHEIMVSVVGSSLVTDLRRSTWHDFGDREFQVLSIGRIENIAVAEELLRHCQTISSRSPRFQMHTNLI